MEETPRHTYQLLTKRPRRAARMASELPWPSNVWLGVSVETQDQLWRLDDLRNVPAATRSVSAEPLLGSPTGLDLTGMHWLIAGGESGPNHRPLDPSGCANCGTRCPWLRGVEPQLQQPLGADRVGGRGARRVDFLIAASRCIWRATPTSSPPQTASIRSRVLATALSLVR